MKLKLKEKNDYLRLLNINVPWEDLKGVYDKEFKKIKSNYSMPGFRKGSVPDNILRKNLGSSIDSNFVDHAINIYYKKALEELKLHPINQGQVKDLDFKEKSDLKFDIEFEVMPEYELPNYKKKNKIKTEKYIANDTDINEAIKNLQNQFAQAKSVDGKIKTGHFVYGDFDKLDENNEIIKDNTLKNHCIKMGEGLFVKDLEKNFLNKKVNDSVDVTIKQDSGNVKYRVKINKVEEQILPEVNDEFAKLVNNKVAGIKELKKQILDNIQNNLDSENKKILNQKIMDFFVDKTKFEPPFSMVSGYKKQLVEQYKEDFKAKNQSYEEEKIEKDCDKIAYNMVKWYMLKQKIQINESLSISSDNIKKHIENIIKDNPAQKNAIEDYYSKEENKNQLYNNLVDEKLFDHLSEYFKNNAKEISTDQLRSKRNKK